MEIETAGDEVEVERVIDSHVNTLGTSYLVRWVGFGPEHDQWVAVQDCNCDELIAAYWAETDGADGSDADADGSDDGADDDATTGCDDADDPSVDADGN